jgi:hypothetical protein
VTVLELAGEPARLPAEVKDLSRRADAALDCELLRVGLQNTPTGSALLCLGQRTSQPAEELTELLAVGGPLCSGVGRSRDSASGGPV